MHGDLIGRLIKGRYKLIDERGRGNFATVYIARDMENNHIYAVKVMHVELSNDGELIARFQTLLIDMSYDDPDVRPLCDLEGLKAWYPGRVTGYQALEEAVELAGFYDQQGNITATDYDF